MNNKARMKILGVSLDMVDMDGAIKIFKELMGAGSCSLIVTPNSEIVVNAGKDAELMEIINSADLVIPDGIGLVYASKILGSPLKERVTGIDFLSEALSILADERKSVFLLGSSPGDKGAKGTAELAGENIKKAFPGIKIAGSYHGYFNQDDEEGIVEMINDSKADFLCVALGSPKQEKFMNSHKEQLVTKAAIGVGGSLDVWAGTVRRAPEFFCKHGLEWLYRFIKQPSRYKRMMALPVFMIKVLWSSVWVRKGLQVKS